jgi:Cohesin domain.
MKNILTILLRHKIRAAIVAAVLLLSAAVLTIFLYHPYLKDAASHEKVHVSAGQKIILTVTAKSVNDMYGYQFRVNYDEKKLEYKGELKSEVNDISTIFAKAFEGYQQIGATMIGDKPGVSGKDMVICKMEFAAPKTCTITDSTLGISKTDVVSSTLKYDEDVSGWSYKIETLSN